MKILNEKVKKIDEKKSLNFFGWHCCVNQKVGPLWKRISFNNNIDDWLEGETI